MSSVYITKYPIHVALAQDTANKPTRGWDMNDPKFRHRAVMALFGNLKSATPRKEAGVLFRAEYHAGQPPFFLIQSLISPVHISAETEIKHIELPAYEKGCVVSFQLSVNAIRRDSKQRASGGKAHPVPFDGVTDTGVQQTMTAWLQHKLLPALSDITITKHRREVLGADRSGRSSHPMTVQVDTVEGVATVNDGAALNKLRLDGVGRAKSYGCGLLTVQSI